MLSITSKHNIKSNLILSNKMRSIQAKHKVCEVRNSGVVKQPPKICIIGAGLSGMCAAMQLKRKLGLENFEIFDTNDDFGGVWCANTYPGCECDVAIHLYTFSFEPRSDWSATNAKQPDIFDYYKSLGRKYDLYKHFHPKNAVKLIVWNDSLNQWIVTVHDMTLNTEQQLAFDLIISATGNLRYPNIPEIFDNFKGPKMHSAQWDKNIEIENKTVAIVGTGTTAVQLIPAIVGNVKKIVSYQRSPSWVIPQFYHEYSPFTKWAFKYIPGVQKAYRWTWFQIYETNHLVFRPDKLLSHIMRPIAKKLANYNLISKVNDQELCEKLRPDYKFGCKRPCANSKYFVALAKPNVKVIRDEIVRVKDHSIITENGQEEQIDVLILATGFRVQDFFAPMKIIGKNQKDILEEWKSDKPNHYKAMTSYDMPNFFNILGPGADAGHNSLVFVTECQVKWILQIVKEMMDRHADRFEVKKEIQDNYMKNLHTRMKNTIWAHPSCYSSYSNSRGVVTIKHYDGMITLWRKLRKVDFNKFNFY